MSKLQKNYCWCLGVIILLILMLSVVSAVRINEVMPNPLDDCKDCTEWIELYSNISINLTNWVINITNKQEVFNLSIEDFLIITKNKTAFLDIWNITENKVIEWSSMALTNTGKNIFIFDNSSQPIDNLTYPDFSLKENKSYSLLSNLSWVICNYPTPGFENFCSFSQENPPEQNSTQNSSNEEEEIPEIFISLVYDEQITNGEEFDVKIKAYNLKDEDYDIKIYITKKGTETIISETHNNETWKSSNYYVSNIISGQGNKSETLILRISSSYKEFIGEAEIKARIKKSSSSTYIVSYEDEIEINERKGEENTTIQEQKTAQNTIKDDKEEIIRLNTIKEDLKTPENKTYLSKEGYLKEYTIYFFTLFCVFVLVYIIIKK